MNQPIGQQLANNETISNIKNNVSDLASGAVNSLKNARENINNSLQDFSSKSIKQQGSEFFQSNSIIAKFAFLILVLIVFMVLFKFGTYLLNYFLKPKLSPYIINGLIPGNKNVIVPQDPKKSGSITIYRSNNENTGMEFTWSVWLNISPDNFTQSTELVKLKHIFSKGGDGNYDIDGIMKIHNSPGLYLDYDTDNKQYKLKVFMSTVSSTNTSESETVEVDSIPINQWFNLMIRLENKIMDIYINGAIVKRLAFTNSPKQNYDDVHVCGNGGFSGSLSDLRYFNKSLNIFEINSVVYSGPNLKSNSAMSNTKVFDYLSSAWYSNNNM
jgi:hypothetical protein